MAGGRVQSMTVAHTGGERGVCGKAQSATPRGRGRVAPRRASPPDGPDDSRLSIRATKRGRGAVLGTGSGGRQDLRHHHDRRPTREASGQINSVVGGSASDGPHIGAIGPLLVGDPDSHPSGQTRVSVGTPWLGGHAWVGAPPRPQQRRSPLVAQGAMSDHRAVQPPCPPVPLS